ncbi:MAG TPA: LysR family transcriptional regulator [Devosia sp.]|nr:LysR family transcriptional regulator [Devosia sp.]
MIRLRHLRAFEAIASLGSMSAAADAIHLSQPALSQAVAGLEATFGTVLLQRTPTGSFLTAEGRILLVRVQRALRRIEEAVQEAAEAGRSSMSSDPVSVRNVTATQMYALLAVDEHGSFTAAGKALGISQSAINRSIRDLETNLRRALCMRTAIGKACNRVGARLARQLRLARQEIRYGEEELAAARGEIHGSIRIGILPLGASQLLSQALSRLAEDYPLMHATILESPYEALYAWLTSGHIDLIIGTLRPVTPGPEVIEYPLFDDPYCLVARRQHPLEAKKAIGYADLGGFEWILPRFDTPRRKALDNLLAQVDAPRTNIETSSMVTTRDLLMNSDRITLLSKDQVLFEEQLGILWSLPMELPNAQRVIGYTTRSDWLPTELQRAFITRLADLAQQQHGEGYAASR